MDREKHPVDRSPLRREISLQNGERTPFCTERDHGSLSPIFVIWILIFGLCPPFSCVYFCFSCKTEEEDISPIALRFRIQSSAKPPDSVEATAASGYKAKLRYHTVPIQYPEKQYSSRCITSSPARLSTLCHVNVRAAHDRHRKS